MPTSNQQKEKTQDLTTLLSLKNKKDPILNSKEISYEVSNLCCTHFQDMRTVTKILPIYYDARNFTAI